MAPRGRPRGRRLALQEVHVVEDFAARAAPPETRDLVIRDGDEAMPRSRRRGWPGGGHRAPPERVVDDVQIVHEHLLGARVLVVASASAEDDVRDGSVGRAARAATFAVSAREPDGRAGVRLSPRRALARGQQALSPLRASATDREHLPGVTPRGPAPQARALVGGPPAVAPARARRRGVEPPAATRALGVGLVRSEHARGRLRGRLRDGTHRASRLR